MKAILVDNRTEFVITWYWRIVQSLVYEGISLQVAKKAAKRVFLTHMNLDIENVLPCEQTEKMV